ncbi:MULTISPECIES: DNA sulfur modification protein DndE [unclassified Sphingomonas]|uniref:DNA sulfur modification protein DndE n=1 Tax=unclassified Sphingomonas TaxID=196159 RepID=UPI000A513405|nr:MULTISPECIES: DNA sulfur modification protein DndE [unclassified Sphingomonas]
MHFSKVSISLDATSKLRSLRQRTGLTPNLLCRFGLMLSLEEGPVGTVRAPDQEGQEFNAYTLTGELNGVFASLIRFVECEDEEGASLDDAEVLARMQAHIHRGVGTLAVRAKSPVDIARLGMNALAA